MTLRNFCFFILIILTFSLAKAKISVNFVTDSYNVMDDAFKALINEFNKYSDERNLDIELVMTYFTDSNDTIGYNDYSSTLSLFTKKNNKYDVFAYDPLYLNIFSPYLLELDEYLPKELMDLYSSEVNKKLVYHDGHYRGLPLMLMLSVLFSNNELLQRYDKPIPKTWDQLIEITQYILNKEKEKGNTDISGYAPLFPNGDNTLNAFYQLLHSFRDNKDDDIPKYTSQNARDAMEKLIEIRDKISSKELFKLPENQIVQQMFMGKFIFTHFFSSLQLPHLTMSVLPGKKEGINSSIIGGFNLGINKNIPKDRMNASLEVIKVINSEEFQKEFIIKQLGYITSIEKLYNDPEVCKYIPCGILEEVQYYYRPQASKKYINLFNDKAVLNIQNFIDGKLTVDEVLTNIDDITRIYYLDIKSTTGTIILSILIGISCIVIITTLFIFVPRFKSHFTFLSTDLWIIYSLGSILILLSMFEYFNESTERKCLLRKQTIVNAYCLFLIPLVYRLIINFPLTNKISTFSINNKYICIIGLYSIQLLLTILSCCFAKYRNNEVNMSNTNKNFYMCANDNSIGKVLMVIQIGYDGILYIIVCALVFLEWNVVQTSFDIRQFSVVIIINGITVILLLAMNYIEINNYLMYNLLFIFIDLTSVIVSHIYIFVVRLFISLFKDKYNESEDKKIGDMIQNSRYGNASTSYVGTNTNASIHTKTVSTGANSKTALESQSNGNRLSKIIDLHYKKYSENSQISLDSNTQVLSQSTNSNS